MQSRVAVRIVIPSFVCLHHIYHQIQNSNLPAGQSIYVCV